MSITSAWSTVKNELTKAWDSPSAWATLSILNGAGSALAAITGNYKIAIFAAASAGLCTFITHDQTQHNRRLNNTNNYAPRP
jgi:hypothetical protein